MRRFSAVLSAKRQATKPISPEPIRTMVAGSGIGVGRRNSAESWGIRVRNNSYVKQLHVCIVCGFGVKQRNFNYTHQYANVKVCAKKQRPRRRGR